MLSLSESFGNPAEDLGSVSNEPYLLQARSGVERVSISCITGRALGSTLLLLWLVGTVDVLAYFWPPEEIGEREGAAQT